MSEVRTRFAVSPTGYMHVGGARNALFDWLVARQVGGEFILRIEDTDQAREVAGAEAHIIESLGALGINHDEGPDNGGSFGPYRQSERLPIYKEWAQKLVDSGRAYADPYTPEQVQNFRDQAKQARRPFLFRDHRPESPPNWEYGETPLRFLSEPKSYKWHDVVLGPLSAGEEAVDDFILIKSDGFPTYNFCHVVDDILMKISHVIRSQEFIASVPKYLNLYEALGSQPPIMATPPWIMDSDGKKKLSKRDGAKDVLAYQAQGFLPEALVNFLATLGWNDSTKQEFFSVDELKAKFRLDRVQRSGAQFDEQRLIWMNGHYIRKLPLAELYERTRDFWPAEAASYDDDYKKRVLGLVQERLKFLAELPKLINFFFSDLPPDMALIDDNKQLKQLSHAELKQLLVQVRASLEQSDFSAEDLTKRLNDLLVQTNQKPVVLFSLTRIATTQAPFSPELAPTLAVLGKEVSMRRIDQQLANL